MASAVTLTEANFDAVTYFMIAQLPPKPESQFSYDDALVEYPTSADGLLPATRMDNERSQLLLTVGYRF